jgi:Hint domain
MAMREVDCRRHPAPEMVWPVRIAAHAFGPCEPMRTLLVSPGLGVWVNGAVVPVLALVNGRSILQVRMDRVRYYHVALDRSEAISAEGLAVASGDAPVGGERVVSLFPDFRAAGEAEEVRERLADRASFLLGAA